METKLSNTSSPLYAVIDLGSNSFHMLITRLVADSVQIVDKVKRKVRLASGLDDNNNLSEEAIARGIECLSFFAERLQDIPKENIKIVATATVRLATNREDFLTRAEQTLSMPVSVLSGTEEAERIYLGVAHTTYCNANERLVLDIGGASTELTLGSGYQIKKAVSLNMGCVTFNKRFFADDYSNQQADAAVAYASAELAETAKRYLSMGWQQVLGGSGTMQAIAEVLRYQQRQVCITLNVIDEFINECTRVNCYSEIEIPGLASERKPVFLSGLCILKALFQSLSIKQLQLSSGALREGLLYEMIPDSHEVSIRQRTVSGLVKRFHIDKAHADRVACQVRTLFTQLNQFWPNLTAAHLDMLMTACQLHEIGLLLEFKHHQQHGVYILQNAELPGFDLSDRSLLIALVAQYKADIDVDLIQNASLFAEQETKQLLVMLRIAVILCRRRQDDVMPSFKITCENHCELVLALPSSFTSSHPLICDELQQENRFLPEIGFSLALQTD